MGAHHLFAECWELSNPNVWTIIGTYIMKKYSHKRIYLVSTLQYTEHMETYTKS